MPRVTEQSYRNNLLMVRDPMTLPGDANMVADWLEVHSRTIGGSSVGAVIGLGSFGKTPADIYDGLLAPGVVTQQRRAVFDRGHAMEPIIADIYATETGRGLRGNGAERFIHRDFWWMHGSSDRSIVSLGHAPETLSPVVTAGHGILEIKCLGQYTFRETKENGIDPSYYAQLQHYLDVRGYTWGSFAVFNAEEWELYWFDVPRDDEFIGQKNDILMAFWTENVLARVRPGGERRMVPISVPPRVGAEAVERSTDAWVRAMQQVKLHHEAKKLAERQYELARDQMKAMMDADGIEKVIVPGIGKANYTSSVRRTLNEELFRLHHPEINLDDYKDASESRSFTPRFT
jgi:predicted phage-related endonuclease